MATHAQDWFRYDKFGLFVHWGLYSLLAGEYDGRKTDRLGEWIINHLDIPVEEYRRVAERFFPTDFDADRLIRQAKNWGMRYVVFTAKHHDGFAMYHSRCSAYNIVDATPYGRDVLQDLAKACKAHGLRLCIYYSQEQDWDDPNGYRAIQGNLEQERELNAGKDLQQYREQKCIPQLRELLTGYGDIGSVWFDTPLQMPKEESRRLIALVKELQPDCLVNGRIGSGLGDYRTTGDNCIPANPLPGYWEVPATLNDTWGYKANDHNWKDPQDIICRLVKIVGRGGNYLLNVGPDGNGRIPEESVRILDQVGSFLCDNGESIYGTRPIPPPVYDYEHCQLTTKDYSLFLHLPEPLPTLDLLGISNIPLRARILNTGEEVPLKVWTNGEGEPVWTLQLADVQSNMRNAVIHVELTEPELQFEPLPHSH